MKCYSFLLIALRITIFVYELLTHQLFIRETVLVNGLSTIFNNALLCGTRLLEITILIEALFKIRQEKKLMQNFVEIDNTLKRHFNIDLKPNELRRSTIKRLIIWTCIFVAIVGGNLYLAYAEAYLFYYYLIYILPFATESLTHFQIITWADLVRYRLHTINRFINNLNKEYRCKVVHKKSNAVHSNYEAHIFDRFGMICDLYDRLWIQTNLINERFKYSMVLNIGNDFVFLVSNIYFTFDILRNHPGCFAPIAIFFVSTILNIFHLIMLSRACHNTSDEAVRIAHAIHRNGLAIHNKKFNLFVSLNLFLRNSKTFL